MNKDEILAKSRSENMGQDERELQVYMKACQISRSVGLIICALLQYVEFSITDKVHLVSITAWLIYFAMFSVENWIMTVKLRKIRYLVAALFFTAVFVSYMISFMMEIRGVTYG